jgi:single-strand DNA-binding protein
MASVNKVILIGNLGRDPETRYAPSGAAVCTLSIATTSRRKDRATGDTIEDTQWHRVILYERLAEVAGEYLKKGSSVYIEGRLKYGKYTDKEGIERYTTEIVGIEMVMLGPRSRDDSASGHAPPAGPAGSRPRAPASAAPARQATAFDDMDDDIPF